MGYRLFYQKRHMDHCDFVMGPFKKKTKFNAHRPLLMCKLNSQEFLEAFCLGPTTHKLRLETLRPFLFITPCFREALSHIVFEKLGLPRLPRYHVHSVCMMLVLGPESFFRSLALQFSQLFIMIFTEMFSHSSPFHPVCFFCQRLSHWSIGQDLSNAKCVSKDF